MTKGQYQDHVREIVIDAKETLEKEAKQKAIVKLVRSRNKKKYDLLYTTVGKHFAEMYILSILYIKEVPYVREVQEHFDNLNGL